MSLKSAPSRKLPFARREGIAPEQASLELVLMPGANVLVIGLEGHSLPERGVPIEQLDRAHEHVFDKFVSHEDKPSVGQSSRRTVFLGGSRGFGAFDPRGNVGCSSSYGEE